MLRINRKNIWHDRNSNPEPTPWERCCPNHTAVIYFWIKRVGSFGQIKKKKNDPTEWIIFLVYYIYCEKWKCKKYDVTHESMKTQIRNTFDPISSHTDTIWALLVDRNNIPPLVKRRRIPHTVEKLSPTDHSASGTTVSSWWLMLINFSIKRKSKLKRNDAIILFISVVIYYEEKIVTLICWRFSRLVCNFGLRKWRQVTFRIPAIFADEWSILGGKLN